MFGITINNIRDIYVFVFHVKKKKNLQDRMMKELHEQGKIIEDIVEVLKRTPIHPRVVPAIKAAHALGYYKLFLKTLFHIFRNIYIYLYKYIFFSGVLICFLWFAVFV